MIKKIQLTKGQSIELSSSLGWLMIYREQFGHDILPDIMPIIESGLTTAINVIQAGGSSDNVLDAIDGGILNDAFISISGLEFTTILNIVWAMAKKADPEIDGPSDYFDQFERFPLDSVIPVVVNMIVNSMVSSKNSKRLLTMLKGMKRSTSTTSSSQALTED